jgi:hypothetical protein
VRENSEVVIIYPDQSPSVAARTRRSGRDSTKSELNASGAMADWVTPSKTRKKGKTLNKTGNHIWVIWIIWAYIEVFPSLSKFFEDISFN